MNKLVNSIFTLCLALLITGCWIGDQDDPEILYDSTIIEMLCQTPELSMFCSLINLTSPVPTGNSAGLVPEVAWALQFSSRGVVDGQACPGGVETVFAFTDSAMQNFLDRYSHWNTIYDIPQDSVDMLVKHHIFLRNKLRLRVESCNGDSFTPECMEREILGGPEYRMWFGSWRFLTNGNCEFIAASLNSGDQTVTPIQSPDLSTTDGAIYMLNDVLSPFDR